MLRRGERHTINKLNLNTNSRKLEADHENPDGSQFYHMLVVPCLDTLLGIGRNSKGKKIPPR